MTREVSVVIMMVGQLLRNTITVIANQPNVVPLLQIRGRDAKVLW
jgi:hypothetical protein